MSALLTLCLLAPPGMADDAKKVYLQARLVYQEFLEADADGRADAALFAERLRGLLDRLLGEFADSPTLTPGNVPTTFGALAAELWPAVRVGQPAPKTAGVGVDGKPLDLAALRGKVVVLYDWDALPGPDARLLTAWADRFRDRPFVVVGMYAGRDLPAARVLWAAKGAGWPSFAGRDVRSAGWRLDGQGDLRVIDHRGVVRSMSLMGRRPLPPDATVPWPTDYLAELVGEAEGKPHPKSPAERLAVLLASGRSLENLSHTPAYKLWALQAAELVRRFPAEPAAFDLLVQGRVSIYDDELAYLLRKHHLTHPRLDQIAHSLAQGRPNMIALAEEIARNHPDRQVRGRTAYFIGSLAVVYRGHNQLPRFGFKTLGTNEELTARAEKYLTLAAREYADVPVREGKTAGELAALDLTGLRNLPGLAVGGTTPELAGNRLDEKPLRLSEYRDGRVAVVYVWSAYTARRDGWGRRLKEVQERHGDAVRVLGLNCRDTLADARRADTDLRMGWPTVADGGWDGGLRAKWCIPTWPTFFVIDRAGVTRYAGYGDDLEAAVEKAVGR